MTEHDGTAPYAEEGYDEQEPAERLAVSPWAIASFALAVAALFLVANFGSLFAILAVICGHAARHDIKRGLKAGRNWALSGLILGYFLLVATTVGTFAENYR